MKFIFLSLLLLGLRLSVLQAQETIPASGGDMSGSAGTVSFTIGQVLYSTNIGINGSETQGVQIPYEFVLVKGNEDDRIYLECRTYPNPTSDFVILKVENWYNQELLYQLYNMQGELMGEGKVARNETQIKLDKLGPSNYLLKIIHKSKEIKTFKIIKNN